MKLGLSNVVTVSIIKQSQIFIYKDLTVDHTTFNPKWDGMCCNRKGNFVVGPILLQMECTLALGWVGDYIFPLFPMQFPLSHNKVPIGFIRRVQKTAER